MCTYRLRLRHGPRPPVLQQPQLVVCNSIDLANTRVSFFLTSILFPSPGPRRSMRVTLRPASQGDTLSAYTGSMHPLRDHFHSRSAGGVGEPHDAQTSHSSPTGATLTLDLNTNRLSIAARGGASLSRASCSIRNPVGSVGCGWTKASEIMRPCRWVRMPSVALSEFNAPAPE